MPIALDGFAHAALPRFALAPDAPITLLHYRENAVYRVDDPDTAERWVVRVHRPGYRSAPEIRSELAWLTALREAGVATPEVRSGRDGDPVQTIATSDDPEPRHVDVLGWIDGSPLGEDASRETHRLLGRTSAAIQRHARGWTRPAWFTRPRLDVDGLVGARGVWGDYAAVAALEPPQRALLDRAAALVGRRLRAFGDGSDRFGLTHGDLMPDNVLVKDGVPYVIDFDDSGDSWYLFDLATLLATKLMDADVDAVRDAWVEGYRTVAPLPDPHLAELDTLVMARLLHGLGWMHTRRETELAQQMTGLVIYLAYLQAERLLAAEGALS